jgi:hypothetical protein
MPPHGPIGVLGYGYRLWGNGSNVQGNLPLVASQAAAPTCIKSWVGGVVLQEREDAEAENWPFRVI